MRKKVKKEAGICECLEIQEWAVRFVEGDLGEKERQELLIHIQSCYQCARLVRSLKRTVHLCQLIPNYDVPEHTHHRLWENLKKAIGKEKNSERK